ncbi:hypothetical protein K8R14_04195 [bacterium]|nr:hypothetical protein [bacterium]
MKKKESLIKKAGKNFLVIVIGAVGGAILSVMYGLQFWFPTQMAELSGFDAIFGSIGLIIVTVIIFGALGLILGGIFGLLLYQIILLIKRKGKK